MGRQAAGLFAGEAEKGRGKRYLEKMEHPAFVPAVSQGGLGKRFFIPSPKSRGGNLTASLGSSCREEL